MKVSLTMPCQSAKLCVRRGKADTFNIWIRKKYVGLNERKSVSRVSVFSRS